MALWGIDPRGDKIWTIRRIQATKLFVDFTEESDFIQRGRMEQILLADSLPKEIAEAIRMLYRNTKVKVDCPDGDREYFDIVADILQRNTLVPYIFIISLDSVLRTSNDKMKENGFQLSK